MTKDHKHEWGRWVAVLGVGVSLVRRSCKTCKCSEYREPHMMGASNDH